MGDKNLIDFIKRVLINMPADWLNLTTHRLDIYEEKKAKSQFLEQLETLFQKQETGTIALSELATAYDYIRLGHPLSCLLEWVIAKSNQLNSERVISFSSKTIPILAVLRKNLLDHKNTQIAYKSGDLPENFNPEKLRSVYGYEFVLNQVEGIHDIPSFAGSTIFISSGSELVSNDLSANVDFFVNVYDQLGSTLLVNDEQYSNYVAEIQHVRRRETIAMTPANCLLALKSLTEQVSFGAPDKNAVANKAAVLELIADITVAPTKPLLGSCGLSVQYAIMMGLVDDALERHQGKAIRFVVPPNCYGGTNDQARRVAACVENVEVVDLPVDGDNDMVQSVHAVLNKIANEDAVPYIIAEIPTNPRVEVPDLIKLEEALSARRKTASGQAAIAPVFILDQTFCPNVHFLSEGEILSNVKTISYVSGSKFPSGGKCTAGYCVGNVKTAGLMEKVEEHLKLCDNEATGLQVEILAQQMPSMIQRIGDAYKNTREFVDFIQNALPDAKINFVSEELADQGFTPSVFSLDLPTQGSTPVEKETYKRALNHKLIHMMISKIPEESKHCVSYGQLKGCYWTIPATSTQGTTKEGDKDYIARVSLSPQMDLNAHKRVFTEFVKQV